MEKEKKKTLKETPPGCVLTCEKQSQTIKEEEGHMTDISTSFESSPGKRKKKKRRKHLSVQQTENDSPTEQQHTEDEQGNRKKKKKKRSRKEAVNHVNDTTHTEHAEQSVNTEETPSKKKKREKTEEVSHAKETATQSNEESEETSARKKKKKKSRNEAVNHVNEDEDKDVERSLSTEETPSKKKKRKKTQKVSEIKEIQTENKEESENSPTRKKKKKKKSRNEEVNHVNEDKDKDVEQLISAEETPSKKKKRKKTEDVSEIKEIQTQSNEESEKSPTRKKKKKKSRQDEVSHVNEDIEQPVNTEETPRKKKKRKKTEEVGDAKETETPSNEESEETPARKKKKKSRNEEANHVNEEEDKNVERSISTEETPRKKKKRKKTKEVDEGKETETPSNERSEETLTRKKTSKKLKTKTEEVDIRVSAGIRSKGEPAKKKKSVHKDCVGFARQHTEVTLESVTQEAQTFPGIISQDCNAEGTSIQTEGCEAAKSTETDAMLLNQLKEFIPDIGSRKGLINIQKMIKYDLPRFKVFKQQGIPLNHGRFTAKENERLRKNVSDFMALTNIDSPSKLFFKNRFKDDQEEIKKRKIMYKFFQRIAEGIPRSCLYVYARGRRMFDEQNHQGVFTKAELHTLNKLHTLHGNNWKKISELTGRSALSLQKRYTQLANKEGHWSGKEVQRLLRAVRDGIMSQIPSGSNSVRSMRVTKETLYKRLPWLKIARKVKTRSWSQCREKWMGILAVRMSHGTVQTCKKSLDVQIKLIKWMYEMDIDDIAQINWEDLTALIGNVPPNYLQRKWRKLKVSHVPEWQKKCFGDIIDFLHEFTLPHLEQKLQSCHDLDETQLHNENEESYLISDIFQDIHEDDDEKEDNNEESNEKETH